MKRFLIVLLTGILLCPVKSFSEEIPVSKVDTLEDCIQEALKNNQEIKAAREDYRAAGQRIAQASGLPDPTVGTAIMGRMLETRLGPQKASYEFEQMIPFPGKLVERRAMAKAETKASAARLQGVTREVIYEVTETYYDLAGVEADIRVLEETRDILKNLEGVEQSRYASQTTSQGNVTRAQTEAGKVLEQLFILRQQRETLLARMKTLLNRKDDTGIIPRPIIEFTVPKLVLKLDDLLAEAEKNRPQLLESKAENDGKEHARALARYENAPDISIGLQYIDIGRMNNGQADDGRDAWMIPIKVTLPIWQNRIGSAIDEANHNLRSSQAQLKQSENTTDYEIHNAYYRYQSATQVLDLYQNAFLSQAELALKSDQSGYEAGKVEVLSLLDSERTYLNAKMAYYQALVDALKSYAAIERAVGTDLAPERGTHDAN